MTTEAQLLAGIVAAPCEDDRWLVLADWLEDQGDPRAELARLRWLLHAEPDHPDAPRRAARQVELLDAGLAPVVPTLTNSLGVRFALMLAGSFVMGSPTGEQGRYDDEALHEATLTRPFFLATAPTTVGAFERFVAATGYRTDPEREGGALALVSGTWVKRPAFDWRNPGFKQGERHPVVCVSWNDAQALVAWLNEAEAHSGLVYALPTEAQWEYACRAGTRTTFFWGDSTERLGEFAWHEGNARRRTHEVEARRPSPWGLYDMNGHVWEWCQDAYADYHDLLGPDPVGAGDKDAARVSRGGGWSHGDRHCRAADRGSNRPDVGYSCRGFRLALSVAEGGS